jgi:hypothetical protein
METNNSFSIQRFLLLCKQSFVINKKLIGISLAGFAGTLFMLLLFSQFQAHFRNWGNNEYMVTFIFLFFALGVIYSSLSFPALRSKEKSMAFLMLPASASEKFAFEILSRIVVFVLLMPLYFWLIANFEGLVVHSIVPELTNYKFSYGAFYKGILVVKDGKFEFWAMIMVIQGILFAFIAPFTGASHFSKSPLLKTLFAFSMIIAGYGFYVYLLVKGLNLEGMHPVNDRVMFMNNTDGALMFFGILSTAINLSLLSIAYFRLKEKEA